MPARTPIFFALPLLASCGLGLAPYATDSASPDAVPDQEDRSGSDSGGPDCLDEDGDGFDDCSGDCDDDDPTTHPGAAERDSELACMRDGDGDGWGDAAAVPPIVAGTDCDDASLALQQDDGDGDGVSTCEGDCDDADPTRAPGIAETPFDGIDSDCDGEDGGAIIVTSGVGGLPIGDNATVSSPADVSGCGTVQSVEVIVDISHSYQGDLAVELRSASGVSATLHDRSGGSTDDLVGTYATTGGSLTPVDSLYVFTNEPGNGTWSLEIEDRAIFDNGTLNSWTLTLYCMD